MNKAKIKVGAAIFVGFSYMKWPECLDGSDHDKDTIFDVEWINHYWNCTADGFGSSCDYGSGSVFVMDRESIIFEEDVQ